MGCFGGKYDGGKTIIIGFFCLLAVVIGIESLSSIMLTNVTSRHCIFWYLHPLLRAFRDMIKLKK